MRLLALTLSACACCSCFAQGQANGSAEIRQTSYAENSPNVSYVSGSVTVIYNLTINFEHCDDNCMSLFRGLTPFLTAVRGASIQGLASPLLFTGASSPIQTSSDSASLSFTAYGSGSQLSGSAISALTDAQGLASPWVTGLSTVNPGNASLSFAASGSNAAYGSNLVLPIGSSLNGALTDAQALASQPSLTGLSTVNPGNASLSLGLPIDGSFIAVPQGTQGLISQPQPYGAFGIIPASSDNVSLALGLLIGTSQIGAPTDFEARTSQPSLNGVSAAILTGSGGTSLSITGDGYSYFGVHLSASVLSTSQGPTRVEWPQNLIGTSSPIATSPQPVSPILIAFGDTLGSRPSTSVIGAMVSMESVPQPWMTGGSALITTSPAYTPLSLEGSEHGRTAPFSTSFLSTSTNTLGKDWESSTTGSNVVSGTDYFSLSKTISDLAADGHTITSWTLTYHTVESRQ